VLFVENPNTDPYKNHALEEWLMDCTAEDCFMLWRNQKAILLGKHQNAYSEINLPYAKAHNIQIVRRITGGGTVFTDAGNIMFTFISCEGRGDFANFTKFTAPILFALRQMGVPAEFSGRNDLLIGGKKFSGNAQCRYKGKVLHHGTLMYKADTGELAKALSVRPLKLQSKGVASVQSYVTNISDHMAEALDIEEFRRRLFESVLQNTPNAKLFTLSPAQWEEVAAKAQERHTTKEWIFGHNPSFNIQREQKLPGGMIEAYFEVTRGHIAAARIFGDFFSDGDIAEIEAALIGTLYEADALYAALRPFAIERYFKNITIDQLVSALA
jgi:lipoate-protein ligase A